MQAAQKYYTPILITNLQYGIHKVEQKVNGQWLNVPMNSDMGQAFVLPNNTSPFTIRIYDAKDQLIQNGREYTFEYPLICNGNCIAPTTEVNYTTYTPITLDRIQTNPAFNIQFIKKENSVEIITQNKIMSTVDVAIYNTLGQNILNNYTQLPFQLSTETLNPGVYIIIGQTTDARGISEAFTYKFTIE
jgi:hypothetical protein